MTVGKVKDFNFSSSGKTVGLCNGSMTKMASGGYYAKGGKAIGGPITEEMTGETYPSRSAMVKHESMETPRMQKQEMVQKSTVRAPAAKMKAGRAAAGKAAIAPQMPMKKGGFVERGKGMIPSKGTLGVKNNKNPGEMGGKASIKSHPKYNFAEGGPVQKYADGGQAMRAAMANRGAQGRMPPQGIPAPMGQRQAMQAMQQRMPPQGMQSAQQQVVGGRGMALPPMGQQGQSAGQMQPPPNNQFGNLSGGFNVGQPMGNQQASSNMMTLPPGQQGYMPMQQPMGNQQPPPNMMQNYSAQMAQQPSQGMPMQQPMTQSGAVSSMPPQRMGGIG